jgi:hypothetical protein
MSKRHKDKGRIGGPFVPLLKETLASAAWRMMKPSSRLVYVALKARYGIEIRNNGRIYLSVRTAAKEVGINKETTAFAFYELVHYGFIAMTEGGCLGVNGRGKAPHWRLTELGYMNDPPTKDFLRWDGTVFQYQKKNFPVRKIRTVCTENPDITLSGKSVQSAGKVYGKPGHTSDHDCTENPDISRLTTPMSVAEHEPGTPDVAPPADDRRRNSKTQAERSNGHKRINGHASEAKALVRSRQLKNPNERARLRAEYEQLLARNLRNAKLSRP